MDVGSILSRARRNCHTTAAQWADATFGVDALNETYKEVCDVIRSDVGEGYFHEEWLIDAVDDQADGEYDLATVAAATGTGPIKITRVDVKPTTDYTNYLLALPVQPEALSTYGWDWFLTNQPTDHKIYHILGTGLVQKIRIAPNWTAGAAGGASNNQIKITGEKAVIDLAAIGTEATILVPTQEHKVLILGCEPKIFKYLGKRNLAERAQQLFETELRKMVSRLSDRIQQPTEARLPESMANG